MSDNWFTIGKSLVPKGYAVHLLDIRNHGQSPHMPTHSYQNMCDDLLGYLAQQNLNEVNIIGHSMGGKAAMFFGLLYPEKIKNLVVVDIAPSHYTNHNVAFHSTIIKNLMELDLSTYHNRREIMEEMERRFKDRTLVLFLGKNIMRDKKNNFRWKLNLPVLLKSLPDLSAGFDKQGKEVHSTPRTLFVRGENSDYILPKHEPDRMHYFPRSSISTIENAGHWLHMEQPKRLIMVLSTFLAEE
ncbi:alpha/beta fold hydrolase [Desulfopila sp. IMCC35008]|uniref:alpha/beta fold hydrolase n=1 Tax=Desulfopila sp. IMCC35008 TaxID=2653858 RepID=UPI0013CFD1A0|nr:alpha/beta fold hydrolase [Desulfopila sp. IMCC35008]